MSCSPCIPRIFCIFRIFRIRRPVLSHLSRSSLA